MRVIITGGSGLIGSALAADLLKDDLEVIVLSRDPQRHQAHLPVGVRIESWDGQSAQGWGHLVEDAWAIVNLAGESLDKGRWSEQRKRSILDSRVLAGRAVAQAVTQARRKPAVVVQASGVGFYGTHTDETITEQSAAGNDYMSLVCQQWEPASAPVEQAGVRRVVVRNGVVLSLSGGAFPRMLLPFRFFVGGPLGSGKQWISWIHLRDEVAGIRHLMENTSSTGVYNLTSPYPVQNLEFERAIGKAMGRPAIVPTPAFAIRMLFGETAVMVLEGQRVLPERLEKEGFVFGFPHIEEALRDILTG